MTRLIPSMLSSLSPRERILALAAGVTIPAFLLLFAVVWFFNSLGRYDASIADLKSKVALAKGLNAKAEASERRRKEYVRLSLPSALENARVQYRQWLISLAEQVFGSSGYDFESISVSPVRYKRSTPVAEKLSGKMNVHSADLGQLNEFLYRFYDANILHRISALTVTPIRAKSGAAEVLVPTGKMGLIIQIEVLSLADAAKQKEIDGGSSGMSPRDLAEYRKIIESRNIFGPPNNPPQITGANQPSEFEGRPIDIGITAREPDENDQLKFELLASEVAGAALTQRDPKSRSAQFTSEPLSPGTYKFTVRVTDSGFPPKSDEREFALEVKPKAVAAEKPASKFVHAQETVVVAIVQDSKGVQRAWIHARTLGETHKLAVGDTFDLDGISWKLVRLDQQSLTLEVNGKSQTYRIGDHLDRPRSSESLPSAATAASSTLGG